MVHFFINFAVFIFLIFISNIYLSMFYTHVHHEFAIFIIQVLFFAIFIDPGFISFAIFIDLSFSFCNIYRSKFYFLQYLLIQNVFFALFIIQILLCALSIDPGFTTQYL